MYEQYKLPYPNNALEPYIDEETVATHHGKHHVTYTKNFNDAAIKAGVDHLPVEEVLKHLDEVSDPALRKALRNNGGGYYNHNLYFQTLSPKPGKLSPELEERINATFGSLEELITKLSALATAQFGSGWAFLSANKKGELMVSNSPNQDNPYSEGSEYEPIFALDVWEHAYYLKYKNLRGDYIKALFNIVDWKAVSENYNRVVR